MDGRRDKKAKGQAEGAFEVIHILSDANRIQILRLLAEQGELCARDILANFPITQPTLSHHMNVLLENHLVDARKSGRWVFYSISLNAIQEIIDFFESLRSVSSAQPESVAAAAGTSAGVKAPRKKPAIAVRRKDAPLPLKRISEEIGHTANKASELRAEPLKEKKEKKKDKQGKKEKKKKKNKKKEK